MWVEGSDTKGGIIMGGRGSRSPSGSSQGAIGPQEQRKGESEQKKTVVVTPEYARGHLQELGINKNQKYKVNASGKVTVYQVNFDDPNDAWGVGSEDFINESNAMKFRDALNRRGNQHGAYYKSKQVNEIETKYALDA